MRNRWVFGLALGVCAALSASCSKRPAPPGGQAVGAVPVTVARVSARPVPVQISTFGTVRAMSTVAVKSQVEGVLNTIHFRKGQEVKAGQVLFSIDPRPFEATLRQLEANRGRDAAEAANARKEMARQADLRKQGIVSQADYDKAEADAESLEAAVRADEAAIENARLQLSYCTIRSPIDGRAGDYMVDAGNVVKANDAALATIAQTRPAEVYFSIPQQDLDRVRRSMKAGPLSVQAALPGEAGAVETGELTFIDNTVDASTGTIRLGATFANTDERLWPGLYVRVTMTLSVEQNALVVPAAAVETGRDGAYVFVVVEHGAPAGARSETVAAVRDIVIDRTVGNDTVVRCGLTAGEIVVTDGQLRLANGTRVTVRETAGRSAEAARPPEGAGGP